MDILIVRETATKVFVWLGMYILACMHVITIIYFFYFYQIRGMLLHDIYSKAMKYCIEEEHLNGKDQANIHGITWAGRHP